MCPPRLLNRTQGDLFHEALAKDAADRGGVDKGGTGPERGRQARAHWKCRENPTGGRLLWQGAQEKDKKNESPAISFCEACKSARK